MGRLIAGAFEEMDYEKRLAQAGFDAIDIEPTRIYSIEDARQFLAGEGLDVDAVAPLVKDKFMSALCARDKTGRLLRARLLLMTLARRLIGELLETALLLAAVVGSGIMGERLSAGNVAIALLANTLATGATLVMLIFTFGSVSGAHFNPAVTLADANHGRMCWRDVPGYIAAQVTGAILGVWSAHLMFAEPVLQVSQHVRSGGFLLFSEFVATFGLLSVIRGCGRLREEAVPFAVGLYITGAYWFTASTSFANPAVTFARASRMPLPASGPPMLHGSWRPSSPVRSPRRSCSDGWCRPC
jgi:glycerol uptake facilitator-like aquaporin